MSVPYRIVLAHQGQQELASEFEEAIKETLKGFGSIAEQLEFSAELADYDAPQVLVYIASEQKATHEMVQLVEAAWKLKIPMIPVARGSITDELAAALPKRLRYLNVVSWQSHQSDTIRSVLEKLNLVESSRKIFISYQRDDAEELANQLHTALGRRRFDVFLDRFSLPPGGDFHTRLDEELNDKAFVLCLESDNFHKSRWGTHEIDYAKTHRIQILALTLPTCSNLVETIDEVQRLRLEASNVTVNGELESDVLKRVLDHVELLHAHAMHQRREAILGSVIRKLTSRRLVYDTLDDWCVLAKIDEETFWLLWVVPRRPEPSDFYVVYRKRNTAKRERSGEISKSILVHESEQMLDEHRELLDWLSSLADVELAVADAISI